MSAFSVVIQSTPLDEAQELSQLRQFSASVGAIVSFLGLMRDHNVGDSVQTMTLEHYPHMTEKSILRILEQAQTRWPDIEVARVVHRVGTLYPQDPIVFVGVGCAHRESAFLACAYVMDYLKVQAPFWKKEVLANQQERWVEARSSDEQAHQKWES